MIPPFSFAQTYDTQLLDFPPSPLTRTRGARPLTLPLRLGCAYLVNMSNMLPSMLLSALYISVYLRRVQVTVVNLRLCTSNSLDRKPPVALNSLVSYSVLLHLAHL